MNEPVKRWALDDEVLVSTTDICRRLGVHVQARKVSGICTPALVTQRGTFWREKDMQRIAIGLAKSILESQGMEMVELKGARRT